MAKQKQEKPKLKPFALRFEFYDADEAELFLRGCILASQNNNSPLWREVIDGINGAMQDFRHQQLDYDMGLRSAAGMP
jgi:hypothetical protein